MSNLENGVYQERALVRRDSIDDIDNMPDEIAVKVRWLQNNLFEGPQYGPAGVKIFREDVRGYLITKFGGPVSDLEIGVVLRTAFPHHVRRGKFYCGIGKLNIDEVNQNKSDVENHIEKREKTNSLIEMSSESATREVQMPMKKRMNIRDWLGEKDKETEKRVNEKPEMVHMSIPDQPLYKPNLSHPIPPSSHVVVAPSPVLSTYGQPFSHVVVQPSIQTPVPHHISLPTSIMDQRSLPPMDAQRYFNHYIPIELPNPFGLIGRGQKRHEPHSRTDNPSLHKRVKKPKRPKEGRLDLPQPQGIQGVLHQTTSAVKAIILDFDVPVPKVTKLKPLEERLPSEVKFGNLLGGQKTVDDLQSPLGTAVQDHQVTSEQSQEIGPDSQGLQTASPSQWYPSQAENLAEHQHRSGVVKEVSPFKVPSIDQYKASTTGSQSSSGLQPVLTCFICKNQLHPGSRDYPLVPSIIATCSRCKKIAFGKKEAKPASIPKFPAACNPRVAPSEEVSAIRRKTFWKCLINHHKTTKQLRRKGRINPRVSVPRGARSVSSSVSGSYPASPQPMSPISTCTAPSPSTSLPPSPVSQTGMSLPGSPLSQLPSPSLSPNPQEKLGQSLHPPPVNSEGPFTGSRPVNSPKISSSGNDMRQISHADQTEERLEVPVPGKRTTRQLSPGGSDVTSPDSISLPPGRENEDATVRALLSLSSASSESRGKLHFPGDITLRRHSLPVNYEQRFSPRERPLASRLVDSTENSKRFIPDYLDPQDLRYLREQHHLESGGPSPPESNREEKPMTPNGGSPPFSPKHRTFMISGKFVEGLKSDKPYEAFCCSCIKEEIVLIKCPTRSCDFVCNSISGMEIHEESHETKKPNITHSPSELRDGQYEDGASRSSVETQSADTDMEAKSPVSLLHFPHSSNMREEPYIKDYPMRRSPGLVATSSVIDLGTTAHHVAVLRPKLPSLVHSPRVPPISEPTSPLDLSGKRQMPTYTRNLKETSLIPPLYLGSPLDLSAQTKQGYNDISYQAHHHREKEQFVSNQMLGSTGMVIERPSAPLPNIPSIQIPLPNSGMSLQTTQLPTLVSHAPLPFFYTPFIPYHPPAPMASSHLMGPQSSTSPTPPLAPHPEKTFIERDREPKLYQGPFAFLNHVQAARNRAAKASMGRASPHINTSNSTLHPGTPSPTSSCSSGSWHREKLRDTSPASRSLTCSPQRTMVPHGPCTSSPHSVSYQGGTISIQGSPMMGHRRISPKTVKIESPFQQRAVSPSLADCPVQVKIEHCSDEENSPNTCTLRIHEERHLENRREENREMKWGTEET